MRQLNQIGTPDALKGACPVWGGLDGIPLPQGSMDAVLLLHSYARVSTNQQQHEGTIESQRGVLKHYIQQQHWALLPEHEYS